jgi:uncharacterized protein
VRVAVHVTPRATRDEVVGWRGAELLVRVTAAPDDGKANEAVCRTVAAALGIPKGAVRVVRGHAARHKSLEVDADAAVVEAALGVPESGLF